MDDMMDGGPAGAMFLQCADCSQTAAQRQDQGESSSAVIVPMGQLAPILVQHPSMNICGVQWKKARQHLGGKVQSIGHGGRCLTARDK